MHHRAAPNADFARNRFDVEPRVSPFQIPQFSAAAEG
jgi:hypothetical protein